MKVPVFLAVAFIIVSSAPRGAAAAEGDPPADSTSTSPDVLVDEAIHFRATHGLRSDTNYVRSTFGDPATFSSKAFGLPLTASETAEIQRRVDLQLKLGPSKIAAAREPNFGGVYLDQLDGGIPVFQFTDDVEKHRSTIESSLPSGAVYRLEQVTRSHADLLALKKRVRDQLETLRESGVAVQTIGLRASDNRVVIGVETALSQSGIDAVAAFGDAVAVEVTGKVVPDACNSMKDCWPLKGSLRIWTAGGAYCTSGYLMKRTSGTTRMAVLTAGHCLGLGGGSGVTWKHGITTGTNYTIGPSGEHTWYDGEVADAGIIWISSWPTDKNNFLADDSPLIVQDLSYVTPNAEQTVGDTACRMGYNSTLHCGNIVDTDVDNFPVDSPNVHINNLIEADFDSHPGDSGGPWFVGGAGLGTHSDSTDGFSSSGHSWYTPLHNSKDDLFIRYGTYSSTASTTPASRSGRRRVESSRTPPSSLHTSTRGGLASPPDLRQEWPLSATTRRICVASPH